jgi:molybdopterin-dependent oxidoreductase alpha subunit
MGGNFLTATPDTAKVAAGMRKCKLTVQVLTKLNRSALVTGETALILPCLGRSEIDLQAGGEQFVSTESTMLNVQMSKGMFKPASESLRSETWIVCQLARQSLGSRSNVDWDAFASNYDPIRDAISRVVPGCERYNERVRKPGGFYLPNPPREATFPTPDGKALFRSHQLKTIDPGEGRLLLTTIRSHDQFNTTIYGMDDRYRGIDGGRHVIFMNVEDIAAQGLEAGEKVEITSHFEGGERHANGFTVVPYKIPKGCAAAYFPEANVLVPLTSIADRSGTPTSKCIVISVKPTGGNTSASECAE